MVTQTINLNMIPGSIPPVVHVSQYDTDENALVINLYEGSTPFTSGTTATIEGTKPDMTGFTYAASYSTNIVTADITEQMTAVAGQVICEVRITDGDNTVGTQNFILLVEPAALSDSTVISDTDIPLLQQAIDASAAAVTAAGQVYAVGSKIGNSGDLNTYTTSGKYYAEQSHTISNAPTSGGFVMLVYYLYNQYRCVQVLFGVDGHIYCRALYANNSWTGWWSSKYAHMLTGMTLISSATDYDTITTPGEYYYTSTNASRGANAPKGNSTLAGRLTVEYGMNGDYSHLRQTYRYYSGPDTFVRIYNGSWGGWYQITMTAV